MTKGQRVKWKYGGESGEGIYVGYHKGASSHLVERTDGEGWGAEMFYGDDRALGCITGKKYYYVESVEAAKEKK
jgi:hypothetical protein